MKISVRVDVMGGRSGVLVSVETADSVQKVKRLLQKQLGIHPDDQRLVVRGKLVQDDGRVRDYHLTNDDTLFVIRRRCHYDLAIIGNQSRGELITRLQVRAHLTIKQVKEMISEVTKTPVHLQSLFFHHQKLSDDKTLGHYSIGPRNEVKLHIRGQMFVRTLTGKILTLDVGERDSVQRVKRLIQQREGVPVRQQRIFFKGRQLRRGRLGELGIRKESTLELCLGLCGGRQMEVYVKTTGGVTIVVQVEEDTKILELKRNIQQQKGYPVDQQKLIFCGRVLEDSQTMGDYNIQRATTLHLVVGQPQGEQRVSVKIITHTGKELSCSLVLSSKVESLTEIIQEKEGVPKGCQRLFHKGLLVNHDRSLKDFFNGGKIQAKKEVCMYLEVKGEMEVFVKILSSASRHSAIKRFEKKISVSVDRQMQVSTLKQIIQHREKIPTYLQTLVFHGEVMEDSNSAILGGRAIENKSEINLWPEKLYPNAELNITVSTPTDSLDLEKQGVFVKIRDVKMSSRCLVDSCADSSLEQHHLFHGSILLNNDRSLHDYRITDGSKLQLVPPDEFPVYVNTTVNGIHIKLFVNAKRSDTVKDMKNRISGAAINTEGHLLYLSGVLLKDAKTLEECHISAACTLSSVPQGEIPVSVRTRFTTFPLSINPLKTVHDIMEKIASTPEIGVETHSQRLLLHNVLLSTEKNYQRPMEDFGISPGNALTLVAVPAELDLYICTPRGSTLSLVCLCDSTIHDVKAAIEEIEDIPVENQILPFQSDDKTLKQYDLQPGTHLDMVHLSVTQLKAAMDQQEMCERAIIQEQNRQLKRELESARRDESFFEMQLDSASNYMQSKITTFEGNLEQSREKISELERENQEMRQRLMGKQGRTIAKQNDKLRYLETKLASGSSRRASSQSTLSDIAEDVDTSITSVDGEEGEGEAGEVILMNTSSVSMQDSPEYGFHREFVYSGEEYLWSCEEHGIKISFPQHPQKRNIHVTVMSLNNSSEDIDVDNADNDAEFVSAVYSVRLSSPLPAPVTVEVQHCVNITDPNIASSLTFVKTNPGEDFFSPIDGGEFGVGSRYGKIQLSHFCRFGIGKLFPRNKKEIIYVSSIYTQSSEPRRQDLHVVVTKDLEDHLNQLKSEYEGWKLSVQPEIKFAGSIKIKWSPQKGDDHWTIAELQPGAKILQQSVNRYRPRQRIPHLRLRATWEPASPPKREDVSMTLAGAEDLEGEKISFLFECGTPHFLTQSSSFSDVSTPCSSVSGRPFSRVYCSSEYPIFDDKVTINRLNFIRYMDERQGEMELRVKNELMGSVWKDLAAQLGFGAARIGAFSLSQTPVHDLMSAWLQTEEDCSWRRFVEKLSDAGLRTLAIDLKHALMHIVNT